MIKRKDAEKFLDYLKENNIDYFVAGSYLRNKEEIKDIDLLINEKDREKIKRLLDKMVVKKNMDGDLHSNYEIKFNNKEIKVDMFFYKDPEFAAQVLYLAGNANFNIAMRSIAKKKGYVLNQKYMKDTRKSKIIEFNSEDEIFDLLGYNFVPYEMRNVNNISEAYKVLRKFKK